VIRLSFYDLYGFSTDDIDVAKSIVERALNVKLEAHDSDFVDDYFMLQTDEGEEIVLKENYSKEEDAYREPDFNGQAILLYIDELTEGNSKVIEAALLSSGGVSLLRRDDL
jgi:hypothetical protein